MRLTPGKEPVMKIHRPNPIAAMALVAGAMALLLLAQPARAQEQDLVSLGHFVPAPGRSPESSTPTAIRFVNQSPATIGISWIDYAGRAVLFATLQPGHSYTRLTYLNHLWIVTDATKAPLGVYKAIGRPGRAVIRMVRLSPQRCGTVPGTTFSTFRSQESTTPTTVEFNNYTDKAVVISWIDYDSRAVPYATLQPGQAYLQPTYVTHPWQVSWEDGTCRGIYLPSASPGLVWLISVN
jgi:VHL beta domain